MSGNHSGVTRRQLADKLTQDTLDVYGWPDDLTSKQVPNASSLSTSNVLELSRTNRDSPSGAGDMSDVVYGHRLNREPQLTGDR